MLTDVQELANRSYDLFLMSIDDIEMCENISYMYVQVYYGCVLSSFVICHMSVVSPSKT